MLRSSGGGPPRLASPPLVELHGAGNEAKMHRLSLVEELRAMPAISLEPSLSELERDA